MSNLNQSAMATKKPITSIRSILHEIHSIRYRIKKLTPDEATMNKSAFVRIITNLKKIEDRRDFLADEIGLDVTMYEETFFSVIEDLFKICFSKEQLALIQLYLYQLVPDKEWDGTITIEEGKQEKIVNFKSPEDVWNVIENLKK